jgi:hypothetical protein
MTEKILLVTSPDDVQQQGLRILFVDLSDDQTQLISQSLNLIEDFPTIISYIWKVGEDVDWLIDKKYKADLIIFNAESINQTVVGYMAGQYNAYYFGNLKSLSAVNTSALYSLEECKQLLDKYIEKKTSFKLTH